ncbi:hypothetical protein [Luteimonas fraxinea]|uniref:hypothetical protein n=1 Tax=Luteimonas fraxinea TaxID=2901869 RepID=UPI001E45C888|nr:hypothetical protein [Luteimonas fraxinea]MCD9126011.1 hypothetical protein [Luteimonas fraxinea]
MNARKSFNAKSVDGSTLCFDVETQRTIRGSKSAASDFLRRPLSRLNFFESM